MTPFKAGSGITYGKIINLMLMATPICCRPWSRIQSGEFSKTRLGLRVICPLFGPTSTKTGFYQQILVK
jgi:hypothetical protein